MKQWHAALFFCALALIAGAVRAQSDVWGHAKAASSAIEISPTDPADSDLDRANAALIETGMELLRNGKPEEAIANCFDKAIAAYEAHYQGETRAVYVARSTAEALFYMAAAMVAKRDAVVVKSLRADFLFLKAYALVELKRPAEARELLNRALALSPMHAKYLSESGELYSSQKQWDAALADYKRAEEAASMGPAELKDKDTARAWRGQGYVYIEQDRLEEAIALYKKCLALNPKDSSALNEMAYIKSLQDKRAKAGA